MSISDTRIAIIGSVDSGKSSLIGTLIYGEMDDGRGSSRSKVTKLIHEIRDGRTSSSSPHIMGFKSDGTPVYQTAKCCENPNAVSKSWVNVMDNSVKITTFIDLAGHEKYLKTTMSGLSGCAPHYACITVGANMGVSRMTREHLSIVLGLDIPFFVVVNKIDISPEEILKNTLRDLFKLVKHTSTMRPYIMKRIKDIASVVSNDGILNDKICPIFLVSSVSGVNIKLMYEFLFKLQPLAYIPPNTHKVDYEIDNTFTVVGIGTVVSGFLKSGRIEVGDKLQIGPFGNDAIFYHITIRGIHVKRVPVKYVEYNTTCTLAIRSNKKNIKNHIFRGMCINHINDCPIPCREFEAHTTILHHASTIQNNYQIIAHCGAVCQPVQLILDTNTVLRSGDTAVLRFRFMCRAEYIQAGTKIMFREGVTRAFGTVTKIF